MGEAGETRALSAAEGLQLFAAQAAEQQQMWDEMCGLINVRPIMPCIQYPPGMPSAMPQGHFVSPTITIFNHQTDHPPATIHTPPNGFQSAAINHGPNMFPLRKSLFMNTTSAGVGLPVPIEPSAVVPDISCRLGTKAWKQVICDWEYPDRD